MKLADLFKDDFIKRVFSVCMTDSVHGVKRRNPLLEEHLKVGISNENNWPTTN